MSDSSSRPDSPASSQPPQRVVSSSLKDRIAMFNNAGAAPIAPQNPYGGASTSGYGARGGLVGNRLPRLDPKTAGYAGIGHAEGARRVSEGRGMIGNRFPAGNAANAAAAMLPRTTGGSSPSTATGSAAASTEPPVPAVPTAPATTVAPAVPAARSTGGTSVRSASPAGSAASSAISGSLSGTMGSGSGVTSLSSSPSTSPGVSLGGSTAPTAPQLLVTSTFPGGDGNSRDGAMTPSSTRAEAGEDASEMSMPATPVAGAMDLPSPGYDLVPGNLRLAAGGAGSMSYSPSLSSSLASQYDPTSVEGDEEANLKDVSGVSTPTGTPRQAHRMLEGEEGSGPNSTRGDGDDDPEEKVTRLDRDTTPSAESASIDSESTAEAKVAQEPSVPAKEIDVKAATTDAKDDDDNTPPAPVDSKAAPVLADSEKPETAVASSADEAVVNDATAAPSGPEIAPVDEDEAPTPVKASSGDATATAATVAGAGALAAGVAALSVKDDDKVAVDEVIPVEESKPEETKAVHVEEVKHTENKPTEDKPTEDKPTEEIKDVESVVPEITRGEATEASPEVKAEDAKVAETIKPEATPVENVVPELTSAEDADEAQPRKSQDTIVMSSTSVRNLLGESDETPTPSAFKTGSHDRDATPQPEDRNREAHPQVSDPPPALDDDSDIVSIAGGAHSKRASMDPSLFDDDLRSNRSSMPPARASSELEFRYDEYSEQFFREKQPEQGHSQAATGAAASRVAAGVRESSAGARELATGAGTGVSGLAAGAGAAGLATVGAAALATKPGQSFRSDEAGEAKASGVVGQGNGSSGAVGDDDDEKRFPDVPTADVETAPGTPARRPTQVHIEPSPHGVLSDKSETPEAPAVNVEEASAATSDTGDAEPESVTNAPAFPDTPLTELPPVETPAPGSRSASPSTDAPISSAVRHAFPAVPDDEHPYVEVMSPHASSSKLPASTETPSRTRVVSKGTPDEDPVSLPAPGSASPSPDGRGERPGKGFPSSSSSGSLLEPTGPGGLDGTPRKTRLSFRSPDMDDEDPGDFAPGEGWAVVTQWEPWRGSPPKYRPGGGGGSGGGGRRKR